MKSCCQGQVENNNKVHLDEEGAAGSAQTSCATLCGRETGAMTGPGKVAGCIRARTIVRSYPAQTFTFGQLSCCLLALSHQCNPRLAQPRQSTQTVCHSQPLLSSGDSAAITYTTNSSTSVHSTCLTKPSALEACLCMRYRRTVMHTGWKEKKGKHAPFDTLPSCTTLARAVICVIYRFLQLCLPAVFYKHRRPSACSCGFLATVVSAVRQLAGALCALWHPLIDV